MKRDWFTRKSILLGVVALSLMSFVFVGTGIAQSDTEETIDITVTDSANGEDTANTSITIETDDQPSVIDYQDENGDTSTELLRTAINDWRSNEINTDLLREVINSWRSS